MRRLAAATAVTLAVITLAFAPTAANAATVHPQTPTWVYYESLPEPQSICYYVGNQLVASGKYQGYQWLAGTPGQLALWVLTY
jgi:hypothetical protein